MYVSKHFAWGHLVSKHRGPLALIAVVVGATAAITRFDTVDVPFGSGIAVSALGIAVSFFIAFYTAQAYDRWWEARKIWGAFVNDSRSFARLALSCLPEAERATANRWVRRHIAYLYAVKARLRGQPADACFERLPEQDTETVRNADQIPNLLLQATGREIDAAERSGHIEVMRLKLLQEMLNRFSTSQGMAERIKTTVFPPYYSFMIRVSIWAYIAVFSVTLTEQIGFYSVPLVFVTASVFRLVYETGRSLVDPFENLPNDTAMSSIVRTIERNLLEQLGEHELPPPIEPVDGRYLM